MSANEDYERLHQPPQPTRLVNKIRPQPGVARDVTEIKLWNQTFERGRRIQFSDTQDRGITDLPAEDVHLATLPLVLSAGRDWSMCRLA